jgi:hypothetical protein
VDKRTEVDAISSEGVCIILDTNANAYTHIYILLIHDSVTPLSAHSRQASPVCVLAFRPYGPRRTIAPNSHIRTLSLAQLTSYSSPTLEHLTPLGSASGRSLTLCRPTPQNLRRN